MEELLEVKTGYTRESIYKIGFWFLIVFIAGMISGIFFAQNMIIEKRLSDSVKLKGIVINNTVYDLRARE